MQRALVVAHLAAISVYLGSTVYLALLVERVQHRTSDAQNRRARLSELFSVYNPLAVGALGVVLMTGAWALTPYKEALGADYFAAVGRAFAYKLSLAFFLILSGIWICFGIGHRLVRAHQGKVAADAGHLDRLQIRLRAAFATACLLALATLWVSVGIDPPSLGG